MTIRDDLLLVLRQELGEGHEDDTMAQAQKAYVVLSMRPKLEALYEGRVDTSQILAARQAMEVRLVDEEADFSNLRAAARAQVEVEIRGL